MTVEHVVGWELLDPAGKLEKRAEQLEAMLPYLDKHAREALSRLLRDKKTFQQEFARYLDLRKRIQVALIFGFVYMVACSHFDINL